MYKSTPGWFDLTERPKGMTAATHRKIQDMQLVIIAEAEKFKDADVRRNNKPAFEKLQEYAAKLQQIILSNWTYEMILS